MHGLPRALPELPRWGVEQGVLPFIFGAVSQYQRFRRGWRGGVPRTFNEKVQYKLMFDRRPVVRTYSDKLAVRSYVRRRDPTLALPLLLGVFDRVSDLLDRTPAPPWVMKASHGSGMVLLSCPPACPTPAEISRRAYSWLATDYALKYWEWQYHRLPRRVMFEEFLGGAPRAAPPDYKFYVIHQRVRMITVDQDRFTNHTRTGFQPDWTEIPSQIGDTPRPSRPPEPPAHLPTMCEHAATLAGESDFVRVDLYLVHGEVYFGELTHSPSAGGIEFEDPSVDEQLGAYWQLPPSYR